eukprot:2028304-Amphidinium_carterae.2
MPDVDLLAIIHGTACYEMQSLMRTLQQPSLRLLVVTTVHCQSACRPLESCQDVQVKQAVYAPPFSINSITPKTGPIMHKFESIWRDNSPKKAHRIGEVLLISMA